MHPHQSTSSCHPIASAARSPACTCSASAAFLAQWLTGLLVGLSAEPGRIGSPLGYRLVFAFLAVVLLGALLIYRRAPEQSIATATPAAPQTTERPRASQSTAPP